MQTASEDDTEAKRRMADEAASGPRPGQSGEGARSAMEQLIQQRSKRDAQLAREERRDDGPPAARDPQGKGQQERAWRKKRRTLSGS